MAKKKQTKEEETETLLSNIILGIQEKKGKEIVSLNLKNIHNSIADYFVVCHGDSGTQVDTIAKSIENYVRINTGEKPWHREGFENAEWILLDYTNIVVHVFQKEKRDFFNIERLWADADIQYIKEDGEVKTVKGREKKVKKVVESVIKEVKRKKRNVKSDKKVVKIEKKVAPKIAQEKKEKIEIVGKPIVTIKKVVKTAKKVAPKIVKKKEVIMEIKEVKEKKTVKNKK